MSDESRYVFVTDNRALAGFLEDLVRHFDCLIGSLSLSHDLDERDEMRGIPEMDAYESVALFENAADPSRTDH